MSPERKDILSFALYPKVFEDYLKYIEEQGDFSRMSSDIFFYGLREGETGEVEVAEGKTLVIKLLEIGRLDDEGYRTLYFEVNDSRRAIKVFDKASNIVREETYTQMADKDDKFQIGASIPGVVAKVLVEPGDKVEENQSVAIIEAMKMETNVFTSVAGIVKSIVVKEGQNVEAGELLMMLE